MKGGRRQGRQRKKWEGSIREWTGAEFAKSQRVVRNREKWRKVVVKSSVVPQRHPRLRDRCEGEVMEGVRVTIRCAGKAGLGWGGSNKYVTLGGNGWE